MDPTVTAAIIAAPVAVIAAGAAYAAGRLQARGTYRGAVDAVRREHQRNAYRALLTAAREFQNLTTEAWPPNYSQTTDSPAQARTLASRQVRLVPTKPITEAAVDIALEAPDAIAAAADDVSKAAGRVHAEAAVLDLRSARGRRTTSSVPGAEVSTALVNLDQAIRAFTLAARDHLNGPASN